MNGKDEWNIIFSFFQVQLEKQRIQHIPHSG